MNCVYHALTDHLRWLKVSPDQTDIQIYHVVKALTHSSTSEYTSGAVVPFMAYLMARHHRLDLEIQHRLIGLPEYGYKASLPIRMVLSVSEMLGLFPEPVDCFTFAPAAVLRLGAQHAEFTFRTAMQGTVMAIQFRRR